MGQATGALADEFAQFVELFNEQQYELSHEALLEAWQQNIGDDFYKGLIQLAGAFQHWSDGNAFWAEDLLASSYNLLEKFAPEHNRLDVEKLLHDIRRCNEIARRTKESGDGSGNGTQMPRITLTLTNQSDP